MSALRTAVGFCLIMVCLAGSYALAGGAWVPEKGDGDIQFGYSRKFADSSWNPDGQTVHNTSNHLFRYGFINGELGLGNRFSVGFTALYLDGLEGAPGSYEQNRGTSEAFLSVKFRLKEGTWPMAVMAHMRTSILYDQAGVYDRHTFLPDEDDIDGDGDVTEAIHQAVDSEWRGLLGEDYNLSYLASRSIFNGGWVNLGIGYTYRTGNLSDEIPLYGELAFPSGWEPLTIKGALSYVQSVHNESEIRQEDDRFGCSPTNCFPDASRGVVTLGFFFDLSQQRLWWLDVGYNQWVWGESTRKYGEPYITLGRRF